MMEIRLATLRDAEAIARVHVDAWIETYTGLLPDALIEALPDSYAQRVKLWSSVLESGRERSSLYVVEADLRVVGFAHCGAPLHELEGFDGEITAIYLLKRAQGQGVGRRLMRVIVEDLRGRGYRSMAVWVLKTNLPAVGFYQRLGGEYITAVTVDLGGAPAVEEAYGWRDLADLRL
jgi:ribosomal protein S18 acetylase RimI-like enzyme